MVSNEKRIDYIQGLRLLFFANIFMSHAIGIMSIESCSFSPFGGWFGVNAFFILSGFVQALNAGKKSTKTKIKEFFAKYYHWHVLTIVVMVPFAIYSVFDGGKSIRYLITCIVAQLTLLQSMIPLQQIILSFSSPEWYLSCFFLIIIITNPFVDQLKKIFLAKKKMCRNRFGAYLFSSSFSTLH